MFTRRNQRISNDVEGSRMRIANRLAKSTSLRQKRTLAINPLFYDALERALYNYLKAKLKIKTDDFSKEKIMELLAVKNLPPMETSSFAALLENCEIARYSPATDVKMQQDFDQALQVISNIDKNYEKAIDVIFCNAFYLSRFWTRK